MHVRFAGASQPALQVDGGELDLDHASFTSNSGNTIQLNPIAAGTYNLTDVTLSGLTGTSLGVFVNSAAATVHSTNLTVDTSSTAAAVRTINAGGWNSTGTTLTGSGFKAIHFQGGTIIDTRAWEDSAVYHLTSNVTVAGGTSLTVPGGTVVKSSSTGRVTVQGSLHAAGTAEQAVTLSSIHDDTIVGDTNGNAGATLPAAGNWNGLLASGATGSPTRCFVMAEPRRRSCRSTAAGCTWTMSRSATASPRPCNSVPVPPGPMP